MYYLYLRADIEHTKAVYDWETAEEAFAQETGTYNGVTFDLYKREKKDVFVKALGDLLRLKSYVTEDSDIADLFFMRGYVTYMDNYIYKDETEGRRLHSRVPRNYLELIYQKKLRSGQFERAIKRAGSGIEKRGHVYRRCLCCRGPNRWNDKVWNDTSKPLSYGKRGSDITCSPRCWLTFYDAYGGY